MVKSMLTSTQQKIYEIIKKYVQENGVSPSLREIASILGVSTKSVSLISRYLTVLEQQGYIKLLPNRQRNIQLVDREPSTMMGIPLLGRIAAGKPIEAITDHAVLDFQPFFRDDKLFALEVKGDSMIDDGIFDGDKVICRSQQTAREGEVVVALINQQEATLKRISYKTKDHITLIPANSSMTQQIFPSQWVTIQGVMVALWRLRMN